MFLLLRNNIVYYQHRPRLLKYICIKFTFIKEQQVLLPKLHIVYKIYITIQR